MGQSNNSKQWMKLLGQLSKRSGLPLSWIKSQIWWFDDKINLFGPIHLTQSGMLTELRLHQTRNEFPLLKPLIKTSMVIPYWFCTVHD